MVQAVPLGAGGSENPTRHHRQPDPRAYLLQGGAFVPSVEIW